MPQIGVAIAGALTAFKATAIGTFLTKTFVGKLLLSVALSGLQAALTPTPTVKAAGIVTETSLTGSTQPMSFVLGTYATAGKLAAPPMAHGNVGKTPNAYRTYVVTLGAVSGMQMLRLMINGEYVALGATAHPDYGRPILGRYEGYAWVKYYDGTQVAADPMLLAKYGADPVRPWAADMVGTGLCYAILTFRFSQSIWTSGEPGWRFELGSAPVYDPRLDSSVGGSGAQRWANRATWAAATNPLVLAYNVMRGISLPGLGVWGGEFAAEDLPLAHWFAAMNACDLTVTLPGGGTEPRYRAGYEVTVDMEPATVLEELFKACATQIAEVGGVFKPRTGGPGLPVFWFTDDDIVITSPQELDPFPSGESRYNGVTSTGPDPEALWEARPDPDLYNPTWEAEDGGKRRVASLQMPACPYPLQRQRLMLAYIKDERRFLSHSHTLPPDAAVLEPLDVAAWTSAYNGYTAKAFELAEMQDDQPSILQAVTMREVDPTDYADPAAYGTRPPVISTARLPIASQALAGFSVVAGATPDAAGTARRPHLRLIWDGVDQDGVTGVEWEVRLTTGGVAVANGSTSNVATGELRITNGILALTSYQARARQIATWPVSWSSWITAVTGDVRLGSADLATSVNTDIAKGISDAALAQAAADAVQLEHDTLVAGFVGDLATAFGETKSLARVGLEGAIYDPTFNQWTSGNLAAANWSARTNVSTYCVKFAGEFGGGLYAVVPSGAASVVVAATNGPSLGITGLDPAADYVVLTLHVDYMSGNPAGATARVEWSNDNATWTRGDAFGVTTTIGYFTQWGISPKPGTRQVVQALWKRPAGITGYIRARIDPKLTGVSDAQEMKVHLFNVAPATQAQIDAMGLYVVATADPLVPITVRGIGAALAQVNTALSAQVGANKATLLSDYYTKVSTDGAIAAASLTLSASTAAKGKVLFQSTTPAVGDQLAQNLWIDTTTSQNTPKRWNGSSWVAVTDKTATDAATLAATKGKVLVQSTTPAAGDQLVQNLWIDTTTSLNTPKQWNGSAWVAVTDKTATDAASLAATKGKVIVQSTAPAVGDRLAQNLWIDTTGGANTPKQWNGSAWVAVTDKTATDAATLAATKGKVIIQNGTPAAGDQLAQNLWIDTTGGANTPKRWNGSAWVVVTDKTATDAATAAANVTANLATNYLTTTAVGSAIAASEVSMSAQIGGVSDSITGFQKLLLLTSDLSGGAAVTVQSAAASGGQASSVLVLEGATARTFTGATNGAALLIPATKHLLFAGQRVKIGVLAQQAASGTATKFGVTYTSTNGNSGYMAAADNLTANPKWFFFYYDVPASPSGGAAYLAIFGDDSKTGKRTQVLKVFIDLAVLANDVETLPTLAANVTSILGARADLLTGTALAALFTQLSVSTTAGPGYGVSATVTAQGAAVATLEGNASASYSLKVGAGGANAGLGLVAFNTPGGGVFSALKLRADSIGLFGDVLVSAGNLYPDHDMLEEGFYTTNTAASYTFATNATPELGQRLIELAVSVDLENVQSGWVPVEPATEYLVRGTSWVAGGGTGTSLVLVQTGSISSGGVVTTLTTATVNTRTNLGLVLPDASGQLTVTTGPNARRMRFVLQRAAGGTGAARMGGLRIEKKAGADLVVDGSLEARHVKAGSMTADDIRAGMMNARNLEVTELLKITSGTGALSVGKVSAFDTTNDGAYFGRTLEPGGGYGFGFAAGKKVGGVAQSIQATAQSGLKLLNADFFVTATASPVEVDVTTSQTITLPVGSVTMSLTLQAAGGGGMAGNSAAGATLTPSGSGGNITVQLWDGLTNTGISWSATGGVGATTQHANSSGYGGESSPFGPGGGQSADATNYGAGGGGGYGIQSRSGGDGGKAGQNITIEAYSIVALANPKLVITIGAGGVGGLSNSGAGNGGAGGPGLVRYATSAAVETRASVIPLKPTYTGTISKANGGALTFPNYGAGLWELNATNNNNLALDFVETHIAGDQVRFVAGTYAAFISDKTPVDLATSATAITYSYRFYKLGAWV